MVKEKSNELTRWRNKKLHGSLDTFTLGTGLSTNAQSKCNNFKILDSEQNLITIGLTGMHSTRKRLMEQ